MSARIIALALLLWGTLPFAAGPAPAPFHSRLENEVLAAINRARTDPLAYAGDLRRLRESFRDRFSYVDDGVNYLTQEGVDAVDEAIAFLQRVRAVPALAASHGLALAARDLVLDQALRGGTGHAASDGSDPLRRLERYIRLTPAHFLTQAGRVAVGEVIAYGRDRARAIVAILIVDDGVPGRGHRQALFDPRFTHAGVAYGPHPLYGWACVVDLAGAFQEKRR
ncbi:MAG TPA: CAP domain-containing protein [Candidatus Aminicenantes bacterium]|nr:CAP domain-containing protein [Candidatus Aminicenantes bacterium]